MSQMNDRKRNITARANNAPHTIKNQPMIAKIIIVMMILQFELRYKDRKICQTL